MRRDDSANTKLKIIIKVEHETVIYNSKLDMFLQDQIFISILMKKYSLLKQMGNALLLFDRFVILTATKRP